jgi:hypothetical protein
MAQNNSVSRYEVNQKVRMVFARHEADLSMIDYSFMGSTVYLYGDLVRQERDYSAKEIEAIVRDISAIPQVRDIQFDLNNWVVLSAEGSWQINKTRKTTLTRAAGQAGALGDSTVIIDKPEELRDVLDDIELNLKKDDKDQENKPD